MSQQPIPEQHWRDRVIARSEVISDAWDVTKAYAARLAEWVLFGCLFANILEMFSLPFPAWFGNAVLAVQAVTLDVAGFGLTTMGDHARRNGNLGAARTAEGMGWALIGLMMVTVSLVTLSVLVPSTSTMVDSIEKGLILARVIVTVLYGHIVHRLRQANLDAVNERAALTQEVSSLRETVDSLRVQLDSARQQVDRWRVQSDQQARDLDSLRGQMQREQQRVSSVQSELDSQQGETSTIRTQLRAALSEVDTLRIQVDRKQREVERVQQALQDEQSRVSSVKQALLGEQQKVSSVQQAFEREQQRVSSVQAQLFTVQAAHASSRARDLDTGQQAGVNSVQGGQGVQSGQGKVLHLDTARPRKPEQDAGEQATREQVRLLLAAEPGLSGRQIAARLGCSPTTAAKWKQAIEREQDQQQRSV